jgi:ubiquinone/menaquinone biosynthesis C-methylase UbiE
MAGCRKRVVNMIVGESRYYTLWKNAVSIGLKRHRLEQVFRLLNLDTAKRLRILEIGCGEGKDVIQFLNDDMKYELYGMDIRENHIQQSNFTFCRHDAEKIPFEDDYFDLVLSVGVLEHIEPIEKLSKMIKEIDRVAKNYMMIVPSLNTPIEPHTMGFFWPLRLAKGMVEKNAKSVLKLNFFTDHTWSKFEGFHQAEIKRKWYIPPLILNTFIYKCAGGAYMIQETTNSQ